MSINLEISDFVTYKNITYIISGYGKAGDRIYMLWLKNGDTEKLVRGKEQLAKVKQ